MINHHVIFVEAEPKAIYKELLSWGESKWWPGSVPMRYTRLTGGELGVGTRYHQKVEKPFGPEWDVEIISATSDREVSRKFLNGMFKGVERVYVIPEQGGCEVHYLMDYEVVGLVNRILWKLFYVKKHDAGIKQVLEALKGYIEKRGQ